jgi:hypothetical protein
VTSPPLRQRAPFSGIIGLRSVSVGDYVKEGADIVNLESVDPLKVDFRVPEIYLRQVQPGQALSIQLDAAPGKTYEGRVYAVNPLVDARAVPFDALIAASGKCVEGPPGMGFVFVRRSVLEKCAGNSTSLALDLHDQWTYMERTTQWRYTPPTHVVAALRAAVDQFKAAGGQPALHYSC